MKQTNPIVSLAQLSIGQSATIIELNLPETTRLKLLSYGIAPTDLIEVIAKTPLRGPISIQNAQRDRVALRYEQAALISVQRELNS